MPRTPFANQPASALPLDPGFFCRSVFATSKKPLRYRVILRRPPVALRGERRARFQELRHEVGPVEKPQLRRFEIGNA
jgi:hypothetical protein